MAGFGVYGGSKFALEAVSDSLRRELAPHGVSVVVVEPGAISTSMAGAGTKDAHDLTEPMTREQKKRYGDLMTAATAQLASFVESGLPAHKAARVIAVAATARRPRTRYTIGRDAAMFTRLSRILPDRFLDRALASSLKRFSPER